VVVDFLCMIAWLCGESVRLVLVVQYLSGDVVV